MKELISGNKRWLGYILYCIILTGGLLYYRFPSDAVRDYLQMRAHNLNTPLALSIAWIKPWPPFSLKFSQTEISLKDEPTTKIFEAHSLSITPEPWSFFRGKRKYRFDCLAYGGNVSGYVHFEKNGAAAPFHTEIELRDIRIGRYEYLKDLFGRHVEGVLYGTIHYSGQRKDLMGGEGGANLKLSDGRVELLLPILGLKSIDFNEVKIDMDLKRQRIDLSRLELTGAQLKSTLSGTIRLRKDFAKSSLDLKGRIELLASFFKNAADTPSAVRLFKERLRRGALPFIIRGTMGEPKIRFT